MNLDVVTDCSTEEFLQTFKRFVALGEYPEVVHSNSGTQLVGANKQLQGNFKMLSQYVLENEFGLKRVRWKLAPGCAPWRQACAENVIISVKKCLSFAVGGQVLTLIELQTILSETANLLDADRTAVIHHASMIAFTCHPIVSC